MVVLNLADLPPRKHRVHDQGAPPHEHHANEQGSDQMILFSQDPAAPEFLGRPLNQRAGLDDGHKSKGLRWRPRQPRIIVGRRLSYLLGLVAGGSAQVCMVATDATALHCDHHFRFAGAGDDVGTGADRADNKSGEPERSGLMSKNHMMPAKCRPAGKPGLNLCPALSAACHL